MSSENFINLLNNNQGVLSAILFILTILLAWLTGLFKWIKSEASKEKRANKIICAWSLFPSKEDNEFFEYRFAPKFQNKTDDIIKDLWINFESSGFQLNLTQTPQISLFDVWNIRDEALHLTSKDSYKFAPQNIVEPFEVTIKLRKKLPQHGARLYISYGVPNSRRVELNYNVTYKELKKFIDGRNHSGKKFLIYMGMTNNSYWKTKISRLLTK